MNNWEDLSDLKDSPTDKFVCWLCDYWWVVLIILLLALVAFFSRAFWLPLFGLLK